MKRSYDFEDLTMRFGFDSRQIEKVCRLSDFLEDLSNVPFLRNRLSLYGGTALAFIYLDEIKRLSIDLDFNYRHLDNRDWGIVRDEIDDRIKRILYAQGYMDKNIAITPTYPLQRITVQYRNHNGLNDSYMIEIGYMRRIPVLIEDSIEMFRHLGTGEPFPIKTPQPEELYSNKWCTLLYRSSSRDLYDVYQILKTRFNQDVFRRCAVVDSLMRGKPKLYQIDVEKLIESISIDSALKNLLLVDARTYDFDEMRSDVLRFSIEILDQLTSDEKKVIDSVFMDHRFNPDLMDHEGILHERIRDHPMIERAMNNLRARQ